MVQSRARVAQREDHVISDALLETPLATVIARLHAALQAASDEELDGAGLTADQWRMLDHLVRVGPTAMSGLAVAVALSGPTATRAADVLSESALAYRNVDSLDRRRTLLHASKRGVRLHARLEPALARAHAHATGQVLGALSGHDRAAFAAVLAGQHSSSLG